MASIRPATVDDLPTLVEMGRALHAESPRYREMTFDAEKLWRVMRDLMLSPLAAVLIAESEGEPIGSAVVVSAERVFGPDRYVTDVAIYLKPEHRGNGAFAALVDAIEAWARAQRVRDIDLGVSTGIDTERTVRAFERKGYTVAPTRVITKRLDDDVHRS